MSTMFSQNIYDVAREALVKKFASAKMAWGPGDDDPPTLERYRRLKAFLKKNNIPMPVKRTPEQERKYEASLRKESATHQNVALLARARAFARGGKMPHPGKLDRAAKSLSQFAQGKVKPSQARSTIEMAGPRGDVKLERQIRQALRDRLSRQKELF